MDTLYRVWVLYALIWVVDSKMVDLTHPLNSSASHPQVLRGFNLSVFINESFDGLWILANDLAMAEHTGTHVDAPSHTFLGGKHIHQVPLENLVSPAVVINITHKATHNMDATLDVKDIQDFESKHGPIPDKALVIIDTGGYKVYWDRVAFFGTPTPKNNTSMHFPGFSAASMEWLIRRRHINGVGTDRMSVDVGSSSTLDAHVVMASNGRYAVENMNNLHLIPPVGATVAVMPLPLERGSGSPARVVAFLDGGDLFKTASGVKIGMSILLLCFSVMVAMVVNPLSTA